MKKILLAFAAVIIGMSASATPFSVANKAKLIPCGHPDFGPWEKVDFNEDNTLLSRADASDEVYYTLAGNPAGMTYHQYQNKSSQVAMAFQIEPEFLASLTNGEITGISFYTGANWSTGVNEIKEGTVFITDNLSTAFLYTQNVSLPSKILEKVDVTLDTPFAIPANKKIYVGVYFQLTAANDYALVADGKQHFNDYGGWVGIRSNSEAKWSWDNTTNYFGFYTLGATIKSATFPKDAVSILDIAGQPIAIENEPVACQFIVQNNGVNPVESISLELAIENEAPVTVEYPLEVALGMNQTEIVEAELTANKPYKAANVTVAVKKVDGADNTSTDATGSFSVTVVPETTELQRNVVIEEFTSTSCVYCPVGYTIMEQIHEEFTDGSVIPVCVHVNTPGSDPMTATSYSSIANKYISAGVPTSAINRQYPMYPDYDDFMSYIYGIRSMPAIAIVTAKAKLDPETRILTVDSETSFAFDYDDGDKNFILSYAVTEDKVGPYTQKNGYFGQSGNIPGNWNQKPSSVQLVYNDVARQLDKATGITGSIPAEIKAGETYKFSHDVKLVNSINDLDLIHVIVFITNRKTGVIENAYTLTSDGNGNYAGIESVIVDDNDDAPVEYYNLQGVRVNNPAAGIYIRRQGSKVTKVLMH